MKKFLNDFFLSWYPLGWAALSVVTIILFISKSNINTIKAVGFEVAFENRAKNLGVFETISFESLKNLNEDELKFFLIVGGDEAGYYRFTNTALTNSAAKYLYKKLSKDSLISIKQMNDSTTLILQTEVGKKLHRALIQSLYSQLISISAVKHKNEK